MTADESAPLYTVVGYDDWHALFIGDDLHIQGHTIELWDIERASRGEPFRLATISDEKLYDYLQQHGQFDHRSLTLLLMDLGIEAHE